MNMLSWFAEQIKINPGDVGIDAATDANTAIGDILTVVYAAAGIVCVITIVIGGFIYATSNADAAAIKRGKEIIIGSSIGIIVVIMAFAITQFILGRF